MYRTVGRGSSKVDAFGLRGTARASGGKRRYIDPDGNERAQDLARKQDADRFIASITADVLRGAYVDPDAGKVTFATSPSAGSSRRRLVSRRGKRRSFAFVSTRSRSSALVSCAICGPR
jgi:hypothetical protein